MTQTLVQALLADKTPGTVVLYGTATGPNTVKVGASNVAVTLPALSPVVAGDYCAILSTGADRLILGAVGKPGNVWVANSVAQSVPHNTITNLLFNEERFDNGGFHSTSTNTDRITIPATGAGIYMIGYSASFVATAGGSTRNAWMSINGSAADRDGFAVAFGSSAYSATMGGTSLRQLAAGDYVQLKVLHDQGAAISIKGSDSASSILAFWATRVSA